MYNKPVLILVVGFLILQSFTQFSFSSPPGPTITYKGLENGCKIFEITDKDRKINLEDGKISKVVVSGTNITPSSVMPAPSSESVTGTSPSTTTTFDFPNSDKVKIKVCGLIGANLSDFKLTATDKDGVMSNNVLVANLVIIIGPIIPFEANLPIKKSSACNPLKDLIPIEIVELRLISTNPIVVVDKTPNLIRPTIEEISDTPLDCSALIRGTLQSSTPAVLSISGDPEGDFFLSVLEICINNENVITCPDNYSTSILLSPESPIGGKIIPIETTALLLAGAQTSALWILPVILAGVGLIAFRKIRS